MEEDEAGGRFSLTIPFFSFVISNYERRRHIVDVIQSKPDHTFQAVFKFCLYIWAARFSWSDEQLLKPATLARFSQWTRGDWLAHQTYKQENLGELRTGAQNETCIYNAYYFHGVEFYIALLTLQNLYIVVRILKHFYRYF